MKYAMYVQVCLNRHLKNLVLQCLGLVKTVTLSHKSGPIFPNKMSNVHGYKHVMSFVHVYLPENFVKSCTSGE